MVLAPIESTHSIFLIISEIDFGKNKDFVKKSRLLS
jgi:hypothetical protein